MEIQTLASGMLALVVLLGPGLMWQAFGSAGFFNLLWPGPLLLAIGGATCWALGGVIPPATTALIWIVSTGASVGWFAWRHERRAKLSTLQFRMIALGVACVMGAASKAAFSGGPPGELFGGRVSRTLEVSDRPDSRISFHTVQVVAHHLNPYEPEAAKYFAPWDFSGRGPIAGLAAAPLILATGGSPPLGMPDQPWEPFDGEGFAAYRIAMIALGAMSLVGVGALLMRVADEQRAWLGCVLVALSPFFWHELYFSWPKLISAAGVLGAFGALDAKPARSALWLGGGYLCHPLALLSAPFLGLWILVNSATPFRLRLIRTITFGACLTAVIASWQLINGLHPSQGGFLQYARAADGIYDVPWDVWWLSRWNSFANTFIPFYVTLVNSSHPGFNEIGGRSSAAVQYFLQYWTAAPFAPGIITSAALATVFGRSIIKHRRIASITLIGPTVFLVLYWGVTTTGLMREGGHVIFLTASVFLAWAAEGRTTKLVLAGAFCAIRATEVVAMMFAPALISGSKMNSWLLNDVGWVVVSTGCVALVAWLACRPAIGWPQKSA